MLCLVRTLKLAAVFLFLAGAEAAASTFNVVASDDGARMERLADGVFVIIHDDAPDGWPHSNTGVIEYDDGVFVVDSTYLPARARADIKLIKKVTKKPVRYLTTTHWHMDHNNGDIAYREAFPDIVVIREQNVDRYIKVNSPWWKTLSTKDGSSMLKGLSELEHHIDTKMDEDGEALTDGQLRERRAFAKKYRAQVNDTQELDIVSGDILFEERLVLLLGERRIVLTDHGRANSPHDVTIYLPAEKILFAGDIAVQSPLPYTVYSWPLDWVSVLSDIEDMPVDAMVLGHGPTQTDHNYTRKLRASYKTILDRTAQGLTEGKILSEIQETIALDDLRADYAPWTDNVTNEDWKHFKDTMVDRAFKSIRGQGGL